MFTNFNTFEINNQGVRISGRIGGKVDGKPLLLIHGHPQSHTMWHLTAPEVAYIVGDCGARSLVRPSGSPAHRTQPRPQGLPPLIPARSGKGQGRR